MYRLQLKPALTRLDKTRMGIRERVPGVLLADGSFIKLSPNRFVDVSDKVVEANKEILSNLSVIARRISIDNQVANPIVKPEPEVLIVEADVEVSATDDSVDIVIVPEGGLSVEPLEAIDEDGNETELVEETVAVAPKRRRKK